MTGRETREAYKNVKALLTRLKNRGITVLVEDEAYHIQSPTKKTTTVWKAETLEELRRFADGVDAGWSANDLRPQVAPAP